MSASEAGRDLVRDVVLGDRRRDDPDVLAALAKDPALAAELDELLAVQRTLDDAGSAEQAALDEAARTQAPPIDTGAILRQLAARQRGAHWSASVWLIAAAAALLLALAWWSQRGPDAPPRTPNSVLGQGTEILSFAREGDALTLRWRGTLRPGDYHRARVLDAAGAELLRADRLRTDAWTFPADTAARWPSQVIVEVGTCDLDGMLRAAPTRRELDLPR